MDLAHFRNLTIFQTSFVISAAIQLKDMQEICNQIRICKIFQIDQILPYVTSSMLDAAYLCRHATYLCSHAAYLC